MTRMMRFVPQRILWPWLHWLHLHGSVVIAMVAVRMVEVAIHQVIRVVSMRNLLVPAIGAVDRARLVPAAVVARGTHGRVYGIDR